MERYISARLARYFREISAIPRASLHEGEIASYLERFASEHGLECYRDDSHNVLIRKAGTSGREQEPPLLLQAHTDMVTEVAFDQEHDFLKQGVVLVQKDRILSAQGTTLGADDGFGVALMLSVLDGDAESHPPLECLFTAAEEIGLIGAGAFDYSYISARRMLNFDSAEEHLVITGCCGGIRSDIYMPITCENASAKGLRISLHGLCGGHSGEDIHRGRANALVTLGAVLRELFAKTKFRIAFLHGGDKDNAIPRDCEAVILPDRPEVAAAYFCDPCALLRPLIHSADDKMASLEVCAVTVDRVISEKDTESILDLLSLPNGVLAKRKDGSTVPETSRNMASVRINDREIKLSFSSRSPFEEKIDASVSELNGAAAHLGARTEHRARYPGWEGIPDSPISLCWQKAYRNVTGREISSTVIHAGLECGLISSKLPGLDVISLGCNIHDLHTPAESMELDSFERVYRTLLVFLEQC